MSIDNLWQKFLKDGDSQSFSAIYDQCVDKLYSYGVYIGAREENCKDAIQDVFYKLFLSGGNYRQISNLTSYIFKAYKNRLIDIIRKERGAETIDTADINFSPEVNILDGIIDKEEALLLKSKVKTLIDTLTPQQKEIIYMKYVMNLNHAQIAEIFKINPESSKKMLYRAMKKLRDNSNNDEFKILILFICMSRELY